MRSRYPNLPFICDPSHIAGKKSLLIEIIVNALYLNYDGLMIETHNDPDSALSDNQQQITPKALKSLLSSVSSQVSVKGFNTLPLLREDIDFIDDNFVELLVRRLEMVTKIGKLKKNANREVLQKERWKSVLNRVITDGSKKGISTPLIEDIFNVIHKHSVGAPLSSIQ